MRLQWIGEMEWSNRTEFTNLLYISMGYLLPSPSTLGLRYWMHFSLFFPNPATTTPCTYIKSSTISTIPNCRSESPEILPSTHPTTHFSNVTRHTGNAPPGAGVRRQFGVSHTRMFVPLLCHPSPHHPSSHEKTAVVPSGSLRPCCAKCA
jgi:hypothetical protein